MPDGSRPVRQDECPTRTRRLQASARKEVPDRLLEVRAEVLPVRDEPGVEWSFDRAAIHASQRPRHRERDVQLLPASEAQHHAFRSLRADLF